MTRRKWTEEDLSFIKEEYTNQRMNTYQLAKHFNCSDDTIGRKLKTMGIKPHKFFEDLTGQKIGKLKVLGKSEKSNRRLYWDCLCDCGKHIVVKGDHLRQKNQLSCGCLSSKGEIEIDTILKENEVQFITQYRFQDLVSEYNNIPYKFDFAVFRENSLYYLIEFDGEQHYTYQDKDSHWNTKENYEKTLNSDKKKNEYCFNNNIPLIRIPYSLRGKIKFEDINLETSKYILRKE